MRRCASFLQHVTRVFLDLYRLCCRQHLERRTSRFISIERYDFQHAYRLLVAEVYICITFHIKFLAYQNLGTKLVD
jgi:hypothetical protein